MTQPGGALYGFAATIRETRDPRFETPEHCGQAAESADNGLWQRGHRRSVAIARLLPASVGSNAV
jgi:hypothetical protein